MDVKIIIKWMGVVLVVLAFSAALLVLAYTTVQNYREAGKLRQEVIAKSGEVQELQSSVAVIRLANQAELEALQADINETAMTARLNTELALKLYEEQQRMKEQESAGIQSYPQNITVILKEKTRATSSPRYNIPLDQQSIQCIDCFMPQIFCWRIDGKLHCNMPIGVNISTPSDDYSITEDGTVVCDGVNAENCFNMTLVVMRPLE